VVVAVVAVVAVVVVVVGMEEESGFEDEGEEEGMEVEIRGMTDAHERAESADVDDEEDGKRNDGDLTPERPGRGREGGNVDVDDHRMASP